jgi:DNA-directed RNA polymerase II subunit RPB2
MTKGLDVDNLSWDIISIYYNRVPNYFSKHQLDSYNQFIETDLAETIRLPENKIIKVIEDGDNKYTIRIFVGGRDGSKIFYTKPVYTENNKIKQLYPNEARLRDFTYMTLVRAEVEYEIEVTLDGKTDKLTDVFPGTHPLFQLPIMLHSKLCPLRNQPRNILMEMGECPYDQGGYFIIDGSEKVVVAQERPAYNTLYIAKQDNDADIKIYAQITCLPEGSSLAKPTAIHVLEKQAGSRNFEIVVRLPYVRDVVPVMILFRALGLTSDKQIAECIFGNLESAEAKLMIDSLNGSMNAAHPIYTRDRAIDYIKSFTKEESENMMEDILQNQFLPHIENNYKLKAIYLGWMIRKILRVYFNLEKPTDRDDFRNKRFQLAGHLINELFANHYKDRVKEMVGNLDRIYNENKSRYTGAQFFEIFASTGKSFSDLFPHHALTDGILRSFRGKWGVDGKPHTMIDGVMQQVSRLSFFDFISHIRRSQSDLNTELKLVPPRRLHPSQFGYICPSETPSGGSIGVTKNFTNLAYITFNKSSKNLRKLIKNHGAYNVVDINYRDVGIDCKVFINGAWVAMVKDGIRFTHTLRNLRRSNQGVDMYTSITFNYEEKEVHIYTDGGRICRPLFFIENGKLGGTPKLWEAVVHHDINWHELFHGLEGTGERGCLDYMDPYESNSAMVAMYSRYVEDHTTHMEIHPSLLQGLMGSLIPFAEHNQSPRNQLSCSQSKQAASIYATNFYNRMDTYANTLIYPQKQLSSTKYADYFAQGNVNYGVNAIVAIAAFTGYNMEDGFVINKSAIQRGMFTSLKSATYSTFEYKKETTGEEGRIQHPDRRTSSGTTRRDVDYSGLDENGIVKSGTKVHDKMVLVSRTIKANKKSTQESDSSLTPKREESGIVDRVFISENSDGDRLVKVRVTEYRSPVLGDKVSNRHGQKGTIGMLIDEVDMPRTASGITPDIIINPHAIPSRMTMGQLLETLGAKVAAIDGGVFDATSFLDDEDPLEDIRTSLEKHGFEKYGNEIMYSGMYGDMMPSEIFLGPTYYMRLKHMPQDKLNYRDTGPREMRTRQPVQGRANEGGIKIGNMELDGLMSHGITAYQKEAFNERSDKYSVYVCNKCGDIAAVNETRGLYVCTFCDGPLNYTGDTVDEIQMRDSGAVSRSFSRVEIPYSCKLLFQEIQGFYGTSVRLITSSLAKRIIHFEPRRTIGGTDNFDDIDDDTPEETLETPEETLETPEETLETPEETLGTPEETLGTPEENTGTTENMDETPIDITESVIADDVSDTSSDTEETMLAEYLNSEEQRTGGAFNIMDSIINLKEKYGKDSAMSLKEMIKKELNERDSMTGDSTSSGGFNLSLDSVIVEDSTDNTIPTIDFSTGDKKNVSDIAQSPTVRIEKPREPMSVFKQSYSGMGEDSKKDDSPAPGDTIKVMKLE